MNRRPLVWFPLASGLIALVVLWATFDGGPTPNTVAAVLGMFASIVALGVARAVERERAAGGSYTEWGFVGAARLVTTFTMVSWAFGVANVFFVAKEMTR